MFITKKDVIQQIEGYNVKFRYPTISDKILIESKKHTLTRGQYSSMSIGVLSDQRKIMDLVDAVSTLSIIASFVDEKDQDLFWEGFDDEEGSDFVLKVYEKFLEWRESFRKTDVGNKEEPQKSEGNGQ